MCVRPIPLTEFLALTAYKLVLLPENKSLYHLGIHAKPLEDPRFCWLTSGSQFWLAKTLHPDRSVQGKIIPQKGLSLAAKWECLEGVLVSLKVGLFRKRSEVKDLWSLFSICSRAWSTARLPGPCPSCHLSWGLFSPIYRLLHAQTLQPS